MQVAQTKSKPFAAYNGAEYELSHHPSTDVVATGSNTLVSFFYGIDIDRTDWSLPEWLYDYFGLDVLVSVPGGQEYGNPDLKNDPVAVDIEIGALSVSGTYYRVIVPPSEDVERVIEIADAYFSGDAREFVCETYDISTLSRRHIVGAGPLLPDELEREFDRLENAE